MKKMITLGAALVSVLAATTASTSAVAADGNKHYGYRHGHYRPVYVAPAPVVRPHYGHGHGHRHGYWRNGRWIAPVVVGAAIGGIALAATAPAYSAPTVTYVAPPAPVAYGYASPMAVNVTPVQVDGFDHADGNRDGAISYHEAGVYPHWQRNFGFIDRNRDGYLTRDEVVGWRQY